MVWEFINWVGLILVYDSIVRRGILNLGFWPCCRGMHYGGFYKVRAQV